MGNQVKKMGKALMLILAMVVCFNIGVMAQEIEATMAPENVKEAETTKVAGETETKKPAGEVETTTKANETETTKPSGETETTTSSENNNGTNTTQPNVRILFVGNSSTYYNDMPQMVKGLAVADGMNVTIQALTAANYKLYQFANEKDTYGSQLISALKNYKWDYVILQDHREMIITDIAKTQTAIETLKPLIQSSGAKMLLYDTQADYIGRSFTATGYSYYLSHNEIQHYMIKGYYMMGNKYGAQVISSGVNFERCLKQFPDIKLYNADNIHPTPTGSYLAACTIYGTIFNTTALENKYLPESEYDSNGLLKKVTKEAALKMQAIADPRLTIDTSYVEVNKGFNSKVTATLIANEKNEILKDYKNEIQYSSSNDTAISVNKYTGSYNAIGVGDSMIMATTDSGLITMCTISVKQPSTSFAINETGIAKLYKGDTIQYTTKIAPSDTTDTVKWTSNNTSVATVSDTGLVTAKKVGTAKITATTTSGIKAVRYIRVKLIKPKNVKVKKLSTKAKGSRYANIRITWTKNTNAVKYYVYRSSGSGYKKIATTKKPKYTDKNKKKGVKYYYKVRAVYSNTKCNSILSETKSISLK